MVESGRANDGVQDDLDEGVNHVVLKDAESVTEENSYRSQF